MDGTPLSKVENPAYLGVTLDRQLTLKPFLQILKNKASRRLNLVKCLATTTWGANKATLRQIYLGYVRSAMDYALPIQAIASKSTKESLDRVQNQSLRLVCGGMRSTLSATCEVDTSIEPLDLRREKSVLESVERYKRMDEKHPNRVLVDTWKASNRLKQKSPLNIAEKLLEEHTMPEDRQVEEKYVPIAPWSQLEIPTIKTTLLDEKINKNSDHHTLRMCAMETINSYPTSWLHTYTDGSASKGTIKAGFGVHMNFPDGRTFDHSDACGEVCSNYEAEILALSSASELIYQFFSCGDHQANNIVIFTDSLSTLQALSNFPNNTNKDICSLAQSLHNLITTHGIQITLQWIPGHEDIAGNDRADKTCKRRLPERASKKAL